MNKGVIVQIDSDMAYILKNDGSFIECPRDAHWRVGDVITLPGLKIRNWKKALISFAAVFIMLISSTAVLYYIPTTYIEISVNPSIQLILNRFDRVLNASGLNAEGLTVLQGVSYNNLTLNETSARIFNRLENNGLLRSGTIQLIIANDSQRDLDKIEQTLRGVTEKYIGNNNIHINIQRYALDEYKSLSHPLPVSPAPAISSTPPFSQIPAISPAESIITEPPASPTQPVNTSPTATPPPLVSSLPSVNPNQPDNSAIPGDIEPSASISPADDTAPQSNTHKNDSHGHHGDHDDD